MEPALGIRRAQPLYLQLAERLATSIRAGEHPVGSLLPPETELCEKFRASRFTVREAVKQLQSLGLVATKHGTGTEVLSQRPTSGRFVYSFDSVQDFRQSAGKTRLIDIAIKEVTANHSMSDLMRCAVGDALLRIQATRVLVTPKGRPGKPVALSEVLLPAMYADVREQLPNSNLTISDLLEQRYGVQTARIEQTVEPCTLNAVEARKLGVQAGSLGLRLRRTYLNPRGEAFEHAISIQAGGEAKLSMTIRASTSR